MTEYAKIGSAQIGLFVLGAILMIGVPLVLAIVWTKKKHERFTTVLVGAATFLLFAVVLEKSIQNVIIFPTAMGLSDHAAGRFINARPLFMAFLLGLFPGIFEETGRLIAFKTVLKNRKNRETSISHGIGHGGFEVMFVLGVTFGTYIAYALMINAGTYGTLVEQMAAKDPTQAEAGAAVAAQLAAFSFADLGIDVLERVFAVMFHIGASMLVFYAVKDKKRFWLYPLAILIHTLIDFSVGLSFVGLWNPPAWVLEAIVAAAGMAVFFGAYFLLYKKDNTGLAANPD
ncbi:MAG: YhfC family intramembrane metalloprotease [Lachnospiraceae bacterium]|nr:YhfC family intramembrane metalloprotease [Lachnospiraceae bacterium]